MLLFLAISSNVAGQIFYENGTNNGMGMTITPTGIAITRSIPLGSNNLAFGAKALSSTYNGYYNTAIGNSSLESNTDGSHNTAIGDGSLLSNNSGSCNTAVGKSAMVNNRSGWYNTAAGYNAFIANGGGNNNTITGALALSELIYGNSNTAYGYRTGATLGGNFGQDNNTFIGAYADIASTLDPISNIINATAIGANAKVNASNKVRIGDANVTVIEGQVPWSNPSDRRLKENISYTSRLGLDFITRLQTVSYNYIADQHKTRYDGFIAQDVEKVMKDLGVPFSGLKKSADGTYSLAYSDFVMPLVNAVKEQQAKIERLEKQNQALQASLAEIQEIKAELARMRESSKAIGK